MMPETSHDRVCLATRRDYLLFVAFVVLWIVPLSWAGAWRSVRVPLVGKLLNNLYRVSCLFANAPRVWRVYYVQVRQVGSQQWVDAPITDFSRQQPYGHITRLHRFLVHSRGQRGALLRQRMAEFVKQRYEELHPGSREIVSVRFVFVSLRVGDELAHQTGAWRMPSLDSFSEDERRVRSTHFFDGRGRSSKAARARSPRATAESRQP